MVIVRGARAYSWVENLVGGTRRDRMLYEELSARFEPYSGALDSLRNVRFPGLSGPDPIGAFLREITDVIDRPSRN